MILHIVLPEDWAVARAVGVYEVSTRGASLGEVGFLHASEDASQVAAVGAAVYADRPDAFIVTLGEEELAGVGLTVRREPGDPAEPTSPLFPHVYGGPVPLTAMHPVPRPEAEPRVLREDDPEAAGLADAGWTVASTSWGARLRLADDADLRVYRAAADAAAERGLTIRRLGPPDADALRELDEATARDYPRTPASHHDPLPVDLVERLAAGSLTAHGAFEGAELVGATLAAPGTDRWEVDRTAVRDRWRGRGVARAVKSASIVDAHEAGARVWGTGGAAVNRASLKMNEALGFVLEPRWLALVRPTRWGEYAASAW